jgi:hypothetical protein
MERSENTELNGNNSRKECKEKKARSNENRRLKMRVTCVFRNNETLKNKPETYWHERCAWGAFLVRCSLSGRERT